MRNLVLRIILVRISTLRPGLLNLDHLSLRWLILDQRRRLAQKAILTLPFLDEGVKILAFQLESHDASNRHILIRNGGLDD